MEPIIGQIMLFAGNFAPRQWAFCDGQLMPIAENSALYSILGTTYGGDGRTTFALPDLRGRVPMHPGQGPGLSNRALGQRLGEESVPLTAAQMPSHSHELVASNSPSNSDRPGDAMLGRASVYVSAPPPGDPTAALADASVAAAGGSQAHDNMQPSLGVNYIIALQGIYPSRS